MKTITWVLILVVLGRILPNEVSADPITSVTTSVRTTSNSTTITETTTSVSTSTNSSVSNSTSTFVPPPVVHKPYVPLQMPKKKDGMCEGDKALACAAAGAAAALALLPMLKGLADKAKGEGKCEQGGQSGGGTAGKDGKGAGPDAKSKCARESDTKKLKAKGKK